MDKQITLDTLIDFCLQYLDSAAREKYITFIYDNWSVLFAGSGVFVVWLMLRIAGTLFSSQPKPQVIERIVERTKAEENNMEIKKATVASFHFIPLVKNAAHHARLFQSQPLTGEQYPMMSLDQADLIAVKQINCSRSFWVPFWADGITKMGAQDLLQRGLSRKTHNNFMSTSYKSDGRFLSWSERGDEIMVSCDAHGITVFNVRTNEPTNGGDRYTFEIKADHYDKRATISFVGPSPDLYPCEYAYWGNSFGGTAICYGIKLFDYYYFSLQGGKPVQFLKERLTLGGLDDHIKHPIHRNPWRPGYEQILMMGSDGYKGGANTLVLFDVRLAIEKNNIDSSKIAEIFLGNSLPPNHYLMNYAWHPTGQYLALTVGEQYDESTRVVYIIHMETGDTVAATDIGKSLVAWNSTGSMLLLSKSKKSDADEKTYQLWNTHNWDLIPLTQAELKVRWVSKLIEHNTYDHYSYGEHRKCFNASGDLYFYESNRSEITVYNRDESKVAYFRHENTTVRWSPIDPYLLASLGEVDGVQALRLWEVRPA